MIFIAFNVISVFKHAEITATNECDSFCVLDITVLLAHTPQTFWHNIIRFAA